MIKIPLKVLNNLNINTQTKILKQYPKNKGSDNLLSLPLFRYYVKHYLKAEPLFTPIPSVLTEFVLCKHPLHL